ncbi:TetR/AcrR family transcriptional regulator [Kocuria tytonicola]|uniref:TetR/AcrR family transcriptional regulator n=1 Tax=Kocuria tytonicola TaxID=2055946 RepID=A0A3L9L450_9MICC|nr:TetR/AcrR family transcriptional regulator [Kocuria tytonicola]
MTSSIVRVARPRKFDETTRSALIRDAAEQILAGGVESVSLRPLAAKHGCSTTAIYTMFGSRDALIAAVREEAVQSYRLAQGSAIADRAPLANLLEMGRASRTWALAYPELYHVMLGRGEAWARTVAEESSARQREYIVEAMRPMNELIRLGIREGSFHDVPVSRIGATLWTGVHGWIAIEMTRPVIPDPEVDADAAYDQHVTALLRAWHVDTPLEHRP